MKQLKRKPSGTLTHLDYWKKDINRMIQVCANKGFTVSPEDVCWAWEQYSDSFAAGWLVLDRLDEDLFNSLMLYLEE